MTTFIAWLGDLDPAAATATIGGKMSRLGELYSLGMNVPRGFTVTVDAYAYQCAESGLNSVLDEQLALITESTDCDRIATVAETICAMFEQTPVEETLAAAITDAYAELCYRCGQINQPVAVRSSAPGEDSAQVSCAGIFETYLGMAGEHQVLTAIQRCWASLFTARALYYHREHGRLKRDMPMAVGVLELVPARVSGVAFSVHPVSGKRDRMVIEGSWGWGEAVMQGAVTPDHIEVEKAGRRVLSYAVSDKRVVSIFDYAKGGLIETDMPARFRNARILDDEEIAAIADAVSTIEEHYACPVDVEWVIRRARRPGDPVSIVQARPVTVGSGPVGLPAEDFITRWDPSVYAAKYAFGEQS